MLRHKGVFGGMEAVDRSQEQLAVLRRFPDPVVAEFRRGGDMLSVVNVIKQNRFVEIRAAVGAGKSTNVPLLLSKALGCLVIHTIPFHIAAQYLADYLMSRETDGDKFVYMDDLQSDMPKHGVVLMSTAFFHARRAFDAFAGVEGALLYLDESHESDGWTASLRTLAPAMKSFRCVVKATATSAPGVQMTPDLPSKREVRMYKKVGVASWSANDRNVPWAATQIQTNAVMCIDRKTTRRKLAAEYADNGFIVRDCTDEDYAYFRETIRMLKDPAEGIVVMLVDYKFRSSFSIPGATLFIDSCEVAVPSVDKGMPTVFFRAAYDFEVQQFLGRGARVPGYPAILYRSDEPSPKMMCDLESLECDAANLLYRMMGFRPPIELIEYPYFKGDVPMDIGAAMSSSHPLRLCPPESLVPWVNGHKPLLMEQEAAAYQYEFGHRKAKPVSCHTVLDVDRPRSPPPEVPRRHRSITVDVDGLNEYSSSRESSPSACFTLDTDVYDHLSAAQDAAVRPKRVAKRVLEARAAEAAVVERKRAEAEEAALQRKQTEARLSGEMTPVEATLKFVPDLPVAVQNQLERPTNALARQQTVVATRPVVRSDNFDVGTDSVRPMYTVLREREQDGPVMETGKYYHYHDMDSAPEHSSTFLRGLDSIISFCEERNAKRYVKGLPDKDKLYAMRTLVDASNHSTAVAMGMQRLFQEVSGRPPEQWRAIVDHAAMSDEVEWMVARCSEEQAKVRIIHSIIPLFAKYDLEQISAPLELEQRVMLSVMERFERAAVKKDPDKALDYWQRLNGRGVTITPRIDATARRGVIDFR